MEKRIQLVEDHAADMLATLVLPKNSGKGTWRDCDPHYLLERLKEEVEELSGALWGYLHQGESADRVVSEASDVSNFAAMIADVCRNRKV